MIYTRSPPILNPFTTQDWLFVHPLALLYYAPITYIKDMRDISFCNLASGE